MFLFDIHVSTIEALKIKETNKPLFKLQILSITSCSIHYEFLLEEYQGREQFLKSFVCESSGKRVSLFALIKSELINTPDYGILVSKSVSLLETIRFSV